MTAGIWWCTGVLLATTAAAACGRTDLGMRPWYDYDVAPPEFGFDIADAPPDAPDDDDGDDGDDGDGREFEGLSCMSAAMCALCCPGGDPLCQFGCIAEADPSSRDELNAIVACAMSSGCAADMACTIERCRDAMAGCTGGPTGTGGCLSLAWCLVSSGCASAPECIDQGLCYQTCFGAARPEVVGAARDLVICIVGDCAAPCATGLTTTECLQCLGMVCLPALRGCIGF